MMRGNGNSLGERADQVPLCTLSFATLCVGIHVYNFLFDTKTRNFFLVPSRVIYLGEYYRVITGALLHGNLMHIMFNMMSFLSIGSDLEKAYGTLSLLFTILWSMILGGAIHCTCEWMMTVWITHEMSYVHQASVGFSGVIFTLALVESYRSTEATRAVFGYFHVPTRMYPWVLLVLLSVVMPGISFAGHLSGILVGVLHVYGLTKPFMPSPAFYIEMEGYGWIQDSIAQRPNFVPCPQPTLPTTADAQQQSQRGGGGAWRSCFGPPLAAIGAGRRSFTSGLYRIMGRLRGRGSSGANEDGSSTANGGASAQAQADVQDRGRLLPWGA
eukprot:g16901.t1